MALGSQKKDCLSGDFIPGTKKSNHNYFDELEVTSIHKLLFFIIMLAYFFEQMDNWNFGFIAPALMKSWHINMAAVGKINFAYFVAMTLGGLTGGIISDFIGRRKTFLGAILLFSLASIANGFAQSIEVFTITRALTGFGVFCMMVTSQVYIAEMSPAATRGKWQSLTASIGFMAAPLVGLLCRVVIPLRPEAWRYIFFLGGLGLIGFIMGLKYLKESPRWLVSKGKREAAEEVIEQLTKVKVDLTEVASKVEPRVKTLDVLVGLLSPKYIKRTVVILFFVLLTVPAGFVITNWTPTLLNQRGLSVNDALTASSLLMFGVPAGCYLSSLIADKGGRKIPMAIMALSVAVLAVIFGKISGFVPIVLCGFLLIAVNMAMNFITFSYIAENYPTKMRNTSTGIHNAAGRLATSALQLYIPVVFAQYKFTGVYNMVAILVCIPVAVLLLWGLRTGGKSLEEIS
ncbi:MFS transporter [Desulfosporosinus sp. OT]|uniref:MFS transporter n=1 Tax=Desulfosporosinus sp. OT TaxID=913865 RepID=UPI000223A9D4|nr:MFS transporter [Desulfosporosinus sp. OT]EGW41876.1 sugar (and other) transporter family protein [Desulfosporosinus sp. OT]